MIRLKVLPLDSRILGARPVAILIAFAPAIFAAAGVVLAQVVTWFGSFIAAYLLIGLYLVKWLVGARIPYVFITGLILGTVVSLCDLFTRPMPLPFLSDAMFFVEVREVRRPRTGAIVFNGELLGAARGKRGEFRSVDLPWRTASHIEPGDVVAVRGDCSSIARPVNPFTYDTYLWRKGIDLQCRARFVSYPVYRYRSAVSLGVEYLRRSVISAVGDSEGAALFLSMAFGLQDQLTVHLDRDLKETGLTHLVVVSGYQITLVYGLIVLLLGRVTFPMLPGVGSRLFVIPLACLFALAYVLLSGSQSAGVRALIAAACVAVQRFDEHGGRFAQRIGVALTVLSLIWPWCVFDLGVELTFAALWGIGIGAVLGRGSNLRTFFWVTGAVWCGTNALILAWSGMISYAGLVLNPLLAAPWSFLNCVIGPVALIAHETGVDSSAIVLRCVVQINTALITFVHWIAAYAPAIDLREDVMRRIMALMVIGMAWWLLFLKALRKHPLQILLQHCVRR